MTKQVSGPIFDGADADVAGAICTVTPLDDLVGQNGGARVKNTLTYTTNGSGVVTMPALHIGRYSFVAFVPATPSTSLTVAREGVILITSETPDEATLEQVLEANAEPLTPSLVQQALNAASAAAASAVSAAASAAGAAELVGTGTAIRTPTGQGQADGGTLGVDGNTMIGAWGTWPAGPAARPAYSVIPDPGITVGAYDLELTGHYIHPDVVSAHIYGGRAGYYCQVGPEASLSWTNGGDNINNHLAGLNYGYHTDLIIHPGADGVIMKGSHGAIFGGSFKQVSGDYSGSFAGQFHQVFALQSVALGGRNIIIGSAANADAARRAGTLAGYLNQITLGFQSVILGGQSCSITGGDDNAIMSSRGCTISAGPYTSVISSLNSTASAGRCVVFGSSGALGDVSNTVVRSVSQHTTAGDNQTYDMILRRRAAGPNVFISRDGGGGTDILTPPARSRGVGRFVVTVQEDNVSVNNGAEFELLFSWSNMNGTLAILGQSLTTIFEDTAAFNCAAEIVGGGTRIGVRVTAPDMDTYIAHAYGSISVQRAGAA